MFHIQLIDIHFNVFHILKTIFEYIYIDHTDYRHTYYFNYFFYTIHIPSVYRHLTQSN